MQHESTPEDHNAEALSALGHELSGALDTHVARRRRRSVQMITGLGTMLCLVVGAALWSTNASEPPTSDIAAVPTSEGERVAAPSSAATPTTLMEPSGEHGVSSTQRYLTGEEFAELVLGALDRFANADRRCEQGSAGRYVCAVDGSAPQQGEDTVVSLNIEFPEQRRTLARCTSMPQQPDSWDCEHYIVDIDIAQALADGLISGS